MALNKPVSGAEYRKLGVPYEELKVIPTSVPSMNVKVQPGTFWNNNMELIEYEGGISSTITVPATGYKYVVISLTSQATIAVTSGEIKNKAPELPKIDKNNIPLAAIYAGANMTQITADDIIDIRPFQKTGLYPGNHTLLADRDLPDAHPISAITGLQSALDDRMTHDAFVQYDEKVNNISGTNSTTFTLNQIQTGAPTANSAIVVKRGTEPDAAIRFNEKSESWEFTNNGIDWRPFLDVVDVDGSLRPATATSAGVVKLSVDFTGGTAPVVVADGDPRMLKIDEKADASDVYTRDVVDEKLEGKVDVSDVYSKETMDTLLSGKCAVDYTYSSAQIDNLLRGKSDIERTYEKVEIDNKLEGKADKASVYDIDMVDAFLEEKANAEDLNNYYNKSEVDAKLDAKADKDSVYTQEELDIKFSLANERMTINAEQIATKASAENVYTKEEVDEKVSTQGADISQIGEDFAAYQTSNDTEVAKKIDKEEADEKFATKAETQAELSLKATAAELESVEDQVAELSQNVNTVLVEKIGQLINREEYDRDYEDTQSALTTINSNIDTITNAVNNNKADVDAYKVLNDAAVDAKVDNSDFASYQNEVSQKFDTKLDIIDFNNFKSDNDAVINTLLSKDQFTAFVGDNDVVLATKANAADVEASLATKVDNTAFDSFKTDNTAAIDLKADKTYVDDELAKKADKTDVYTKEEVYTKTQVQNLINSAIEDALAQIRDEINNG